MKMLEKEEQRYIARELADIFKNRFGIRPLISFGDINADADPEVETVELWSSMMPTSDNAMSASINRRDGLTLSLTSKHGPKNVRYAPAKRVEIINVAVELFDEQLTLNESSVPA